MAPRLIPAEPTFRSSAERTLWRHLRGQLPDGSFLAANVHLHSHEDFYEADLVVGLPGTGFAVIEVKGGHVQYADGTWLQSTGEGLKSVDPAGQADRAKRLLDTYVRGRGWSHGPIRFEHLVAFPDTEFGAEPPSPDIPRWALIAKNDLDDAADRVWHALDARISDKPRPTAAWVDELADLLGGRFDPASALLGTAQAREDHVDRLTEEQASILRLVRTNPRVRVVGGPGTGKTFLALRRARMWAEEGRTVLFLCYSVGLARWLRRAVEVMPDKVARRISVSTFSAYGIGLGVDVPDGVGQEWWDTALPGLMSALVVPAYDALVVDEAQDFADSWWPPLLASLREERLFVAGDERQTVFAGRRGGPKLEMAELTLDENVRNTAQIAGVFGPLSPDRMRFLGGDGPPVRFVPCAAGDACDTADAVVAGLLGDGVHGGHIVVLTTQHRHDYHRWAETELGKDGYWDGFWMQDEVFYGTVMGFKGLERPVVVLAVDGFHDGVARDVMYAGLSRARDRLVVCGDLEMIRGAVGDEVCRRLTAAG
ncbi:MAG: AAA family ATPase [Actinomycetales bacterium]|nr:AAA family ATPase [Actinomycetales bacterium]